MQTLANRYRLAETIGEGAVATVYRAYDPVVERDVAVKVLKDVQDEMDIARLWVELRSLQRLRHPNIIRTLDFGRSIKGLHFIVMELLSGHTLRARMEEEGRMGVREAAAVLQPVFEALDACHFSGIIHRDVKPENVFLSHATGPTLKLIDFGMAKILHDLSPAVTTDPFTFGTPEYMAPERINGDRPTPASDIYAAGAMAFEMLAGHRPFTGTDPDAIMRHQLHEALPRFSELEPPVSVPRDLRELIRRCLRKQPLQRPRAADLATELQNILDRL
jgi:eukaryotic-like serine/threonine-protein kinase